MVLAGLYIWYFIWLVVWEEVNKKTISTGKINSAEESPNQIPLNALPRLLLKYLEIVVDEVCDINPCPENLIKKIPTINK